VAADPQEGLAEQLLVYFRVSGAQPTTTVIGKEASSGRRELMMNF